jgi:hypothetical protein
MKNFLIRLRVALRALASTVEFLAALAVLVPLSFAAAGLAWLLSHTAVAAGLAGLATGSAITLLVGALEYRRASWDSSPWVLLGYRWVSATFHLTFDPLDPDRHWQRSEILIEALRNGVDRFENRYSTTATGPGADPGPQLVKSPGQTLLGPIRQSTWNYYEVWLGRQLRAGERAKIVVVQQFTDRAHTFLPHLSKTIAEPIGLLTLKVSFAPNRMPLEVRAATQRGNPGPRADAPILELDDQGQVTRVEHRPRIGYEYLIEWDWPVALEQPEGVGGGS